MSVRVVSTGLLCASVLFSSACAEKDLASRSIVLGPRLLGIIADPPAVRPGETVHLKLIAGGFPNNDLSRARWLVCARPEGGTEFTASSSFGQYEPDQACFGASAVDVFPVGSGPEVDFPFPADTLSRLEALRAIYGDLLSEETLQKIIRYAGIAITFAVEIPDPSDPDHPIRALKRVVVIDTPDTNMNPPGPNFRFGIEGDAGTTSGVAFRPDYLEPQHCVRTNLNSITQVRAGELFEIAPSPDEESWAQDYFILDATGTLSPQRETGFYSWFATTGGFEADKTRAPTRNTRWRAPWEPGRATLWVVMRDGRGGAAGCHYEIDVVP